ncbi:MAG: response regulator [Deltaproteobacteria bacterium]|nr:response regulator [Deltaproteobacteria bacterium]
MSQGCVLAVDDEPLNLLILTEALEEAGYDYVTAENGTDALAFLEAEPKKFEAVLLDRMMPDLDGMEVLARMKAHRQLAQVPVILQTACAAKVEIEEGLQAGAYYYLAKPFEYKAAIEVVRAAVADYRRHRRVRDAAAIPVHWLRYLDKGSFSFATLAQARDLAASLANVIDDGEQLAIGLGELFINAVEHGNLGITYEEKSALNARGEWEDEVNRRLTLPENANKRVAVEFERSSAEVSFLIRDQGQGFQWQRFLEIAPERAFDSHGRGIAMAKIMSFDSLEYLGCGNAVLAVVKTAK